jgi:hypothetical protein
MTPPASRTGNLGRPKIAPASSAIAAAAPQPAARSSSRAHTAFIMAGLKGHAPLQLCSLSAGAARLVECLNQWAHYQSSGGVSV